MDDQHDDQAGPPQPGLPPSPTMGDLFWVGTACAISVVAGLGLGYLADQWANTAPWLTFAGLAFGIVSAVLLAVRQLRRFT
jgi:hypothetical protein